MTKARDISQFPNNNPSGVKGANGNEIFFENDLVITGDYTITAGKNAITAGPVDIANGVEVTVPTGSEWSIV